VDYPNLRIYQLSLEGVVLIFKLTNKSKVQKNYSLTDQIRRASMSISANIAEGCGRRTRKDLIYFISISIGSLNEVKAYLDIISRLYPDISIQSEMAFFEALGKQIWSFRRSLSK